MDLKNLKDRFTYHPPKDSQTERYELIRADAFQFALVLNDECPESQEKSRAIAHLEQAVMWANAAIARNE